MKVMFHSLKRTVHEFPIYKYVIDIYVCCILTLKILYHEKSKK